MHGVLKRSPLMLRVTASCVAVICLLTATLGIYFYHSVERSLQQQLVTLLSRRVSYYTRLVREEYPVAELLERPVLIESMVGAERDVLVFQTLSGGILFEVNAGRLPLPVIAPPRAEEVERPYRAVTALEDGTEVQWAWAYTPAMGGKQPLIVIAGHPTGTEREMLSSYRDRIVLATALGVCAAALLAYALLRRGLRPIGDMARKAAQINPGRLDLRLDPSSAPSELITLATAFNAMLDRLADGYRRLSQFSADLAHEMRTPLGVLIGQTQVTLKQPRSEEQYRSTLESNLEELESLHRLGENMLFLARADHGPRAIDYQSMDSGHELQRIAEYFEGPASERGLVFHVEATGRIRANRDLWRRAVGNLVANAIQHGEENSTIFLRGVENELGTTIDVENSCPELSSEQRNRLFDRFYKVDPARSTATQSHGLGLSIVRAIMTLHAGTAEVASPAIGIIRFRLYFPLPRVDYDFTL